MVVIRLDYSLSKEGELLSLVPAAVELLLQLSIEFSLLVGLASRVALVLEIAFDLLVVCALLAALLRRHILQVTQKEETMSCQLSVKGEGKGGR